FRSDKFTTGLCDIIDDDRNKRLCFFEIDGYNASELFEVIGQYYKFELDVLVHRTGKGFHFLSPTLVDLKTWKEFHEPLKHINSECPMTCIRIEPNKWDNEGKMWLEGLAYYFCRDPILQNVLAVCNRLYHISGYYFPGCLEGRIKTVRYPLPTQVQCSICNEKMDKILESRHTCATK
ncbi:MAG: hypothetical protein KGI27_13975, partial [Thaumarchaeota archaeon]|nr:hypothetical protein [Nitrososphaerota archaeon]